MAKFDTKKVLSHLQNKWHGRPCPMCGVGNWNVQDSTYMLMEFNDGGLVLGGPLIPVIPVTCTNCGHLELVSAIVAGVVAPGGKPNESR